MLDFYDGNGELIEISNGNEIPPYWETEMETAVETLKSNELTIGENVVEFVFITDVHWSLNAKNSPSLVRYILDNYRDIPVIFGGDAIGSKQDTKALAYAELREFTGAFGNIIYAIGNHDANKEDGTDSSVHLTNGEVYALLPKNSEGVYGCVTTGDTMGMYFDNPSHNVRYIIIRRENKSTLSGSDVLQYMADRMAETPDGWTHIIVMHDGFYNISTVSAAVSGALTGTKKAVVFCGHNHANKSQVSDGITFISTQTDAVNVNTHPTDCAPMTIATTTEQAFDVMQIDLANQTVYATRVGAGDDRTINY